MTAPPIVCMSYALDNGPAQLVHARDPRMAALLAWGLQTPGVVLVAQNAAFEAVCTIAFRPDWAALVAAKIDAGEWRCTMLREKLLRIGKGDHREGFGLQECLHAHRLDILLDKEGPERLRYGTLWHLPVAEWPAPAVKYALEDIAVRELYHAQAAQGAEYFVNEREQMQNAVYLASTSAWGFATDGATAAVLVEETKVRLEEYKQELLRADPPLLRYEVTKGVPHPVRNTKVAQDRIVAAYTKLGREPPRGDVSPTMLMKAYADAGVPGSPTWTKEQKKRVKVTAKMIQEAIEDGCDPAALVGNISCDKDSCLLSRDPLLLAYSAYGQADGLLGKARRPLRAAEAGKPIQPFYNPIVNTGRTSVSQGEDPDDGEAWTTYGAQVQNLPRAGEIVESADV
jgi:hypothetical protein